MSDLKKDIEINLELIFNKSFQEKYKFTENEICDCIENIKEMIWEFFEQYLMEIKGTERRNENHANNKLLYM